MASCVAGRPEIRICPLAALRFVTVKIPSFVLVAIVGRLIDLGPRIHFCFALSMRSVRFLRPFAKAPQLEPLGIDCPFYCVAGEIVRRIFFRSDNANGCPRTMVRGQPTALRISRESMQFLSCLGFEYVDPHDLSFLTKRQDPARVTSGR